MLLEAGKPVLIVGARNILNDTSELPFSPYL
jgi:hypothetical protein